MAVAALMMAASEAAAREPGAGNNVFAGATAGIPTGTIPPGISLTNYLSDYSGDSVDANGKATGLEVHSQALTMQLWWNPKVKILGADYGASVLQPLVNLRIKNTSNYHGYASGTTESTGIANTLVKPLNLSWNLAPNFFVTAGAGFYAPTGSYKSPLDFMHSGGTKIDANIGNNFWTFEPELSLSYWKPGPDGYNLTLQMLYNTNSENTDTHYTSGDQIFMNFTAVKSFGPIEAGLVGFYTKQLTADKDNGHHYAPPIVDVTTKPERFGLGPMIGGRIGPAFVDLSYMHDFSATSDTEGDTVLGHVKFVDIFGAPRPLPSK